MNDFRVADVDWAREVELGVTEYTDTLFESVWEGDEDAETLSGEAFCGCSTCFWREALFYLVPRIIDGYEKGKLVVDTPE